MVRFADQVQVHRWQPPMWINPDDRPLWEGQAAGFRRRILDAKVFLADNVCEYLFAQSDQEYWNSKDFPCCAPPFEHFFIEMARPSGINSEGNRHSADLFPQRWGWLFDAQANLPVLDAAAAKEKIETYVHEQIAALGVTLNIPDLFRRLQEAADPRAFYAGLGPTERSVLRAYQSLGLLERPEYLEQALTAIRTTHWTLNAHLFLMAQGIVVGPV